MSNRLRPQVITAACLGGLAAMPITAQAVSVSEYGELSHTSLLVAFALGAALGAMCGVLGCLVMTKLVSIWSVRFAEERSLADVPQIQHGPDRRNSIERTNEASEMAADADVFSDTEPQLLENRPQPRTPETFSQIVAKRVSEVDTGAYPEVRTVRDLDAQDAWDRALAALDDRIDEQALAEFARDEGMLGMLEEPDGMEADTSELHFRVPAGHPEVIDAESYVDYLIRQEFMANSSSVARDNARDYLRVIEGGTAGMIDVDRMPTTRSIEDALGHRPTGRHFAKHMAPPKEPVITDSMIDEVLGIAKEA